VGVLPLDGSELAYYWGPPTRGSEGLEGTQRENGEAEREETTRVPPAARVEKEVPLASLRVLP